MFHLQNKGWMCFRLAQAVCVLLGAVCSGQTNSYWIAKPPPTALYDNPYRISLFTPQHGEDAARLWSQTKSMALYGFGVIGVLYALPEESTGWDRDADVFGKWGSNVGDVMEWDRNDWAYNYIGHTYFGGVYYLVARKSGYRQWDSAVYAFLMSTFYWEYGIEAFAEVPSVQDLVSTPLLGWLYGEWAFRTEIRIRDNQRKVLGSRIAGNTALFLLDPVDMMGTGINSIAGKRIIKSGYGYFTYAPVPTGDDTDHQIYLHMQFPIGGKPENDNPEARYEIGDDPVDTGIIGFSLGTGRARLDESWGMEDGDYTWLTLGLHFTPKWSLRLAYAWGDVEERATAKSVSYENYSLDLQRYLFSTHRLRPYVSAGYGKMLFDEDDGPASTQLNAGVGLHLALHPKWAVQADWIHYRSTKHNGHDQQINAGVVYRFGRGEHHDW